MNFYQLAESSKKLKAVIITGNPKFINNPDVQCFYRCIEDYLKDKGYSVKCDPGEPYTEPPKADLWIGHSRGADRLRFAPKETKTLAFGSKLPDAVNHPKDDVLTPYHKTGNKPPKEHFIFTNEMKKAIDDIIEKL